MTSFARSPAGRPIQSLCVALFLFAVFWGGQTPAAEQAVVGVLAVAVENEVADKLGLTESQKAKLLELIDARENEALDFARLPAPERDAKLADFRKQSETQGLALLSKEQTARLQQVVDQRQRSGAKASPMETVVTTVPPASSPAPAASKNEASKKDSNRLRLGDAKPADSSNPPMAGGKPKASAPASAEALDDLDADQWEDFLGDLAGDDPASLPGSTGKSAKRKANDRLTFNFRYAPWKDVLDWFAAQADLSLIADSTPKGTFNYTNTKEYTPAQAIDLLNSVLLTKDYTLIRKDGLLFVINLADMKEGLGAPFVSEVPQEELDTRGGLRDRPGVVRLEEQRSGRSRAGGPQTPRPAGFDRRAAEVATNTGGRDGRAPAHDPPGNQGHRRSDRKHGHREHPID